MPLPRPSRPLTPLVHEPSLREEIAAPVSQTTHRAAPTRYKPSDVFYFEPKFESKDAQDLGDIIKIFFNGITLSHTVFEKLPEHLQRHFRHIKTI